MKALLFPVLLISIFGYTQSKQSHNGLPVIKSTTRKADYRADSEWRKGAWNIAPHIAADSLFVFCTTNSVDFCFYTNIDSIKFKVKPGTVKKFYVSLNDTAYALTVIVGQGGKEVFNTHIKFDAKPTAPKYKIVYESNKSNAYLQQLRLKYPVIETVNSLKTDAEKALKLVNWVHNQWQHNGDANPKKSDAISILEEVKEGKRFRCVEYAIVTAACLNAVGLKSRVLGLKMKDVETIESGAGHVLLEVYLNDIKKWALLDAQFDVMPVMKGVPLNAVELQKAITENFGKLEIKSLSGCSKTTYAPWVYPYLYYFDYSLDNREGVDYKNKITHEGKTSVMLVPAKAKIPTVFQRKYKIGDYVHTNSTADFYAPPGE